LRGTAKRDPQKAIKMKIWNHHEKNRPGQKHRGRSAQRSPWGPCGGSRFPNQQKRRKKDIFSEERRGTVKKEGGGSFRPGEKGGVVPGLTPEGEAVWM